MERSEIALPTHHLPSADRASEPSGPISRVDQFLPNLSFGDAISNYALWIRDRLQAWGYDSEIYVRHVDPRVASQCTVFSPEALTNCAGAIYHHSIGSEITPHLLNFSGPKCLIYHNITPAEFFKPFRPEFAGILDQGRADLGELAPHFPISGGDSSFNVGELEAVGFARPSVIPIPVDPAKWNFSPDSELMTQLQDGRTNILFVGRIAPNKKQEDLVEAFSLYLDFDPEARLHIVGGSEAGDPYAEYLMDRIEGLGLQEAITLTGGVNEAQLAAYYRTAHLFWSMSEHEGFCVPLVEAMWFDVPIVAFGGTAIPETMGPGGIIFTEKADFHTLAALAWLLRCDDHLRSKLIHAQRQRREDFRPNRIASRLLSLIQKFHFDVRNTRPGLAEPLRVS